MFSAPAQPMQATQPTAAQPVSAPAAPRSAKKKTSYLPLFIALGVLLLIAVAIILFFALRK
jgi:hypothetical protein